MTDQWIPHQRKTWPWRVGRLKRDVVFRIHNGLWREPGPEFTERTVPAGTPVKIVMVSRFGDVGITDDLAADRDYRARVSLNDIEAGAPQ